MGDVSGPGASAREAGGSVRSPGSMFVNASRRMSPRLPGWSPQPGQLSPGRATTRPAPAISFATRRIAPPLPLPPEVEQFPLAGLPAKPPSAEMVPFTVSVPFAAIRRPPPPPPPPPAEQPTALPEELPPPPPEPPIRTSPLIRMVTGVFAAFRVKRTKLANGPQQPPGLTYCVVKLLNTRTPLGGTGIVKRLLPSPGMVAVVPGG